jgi:hypothetical protein
MDYETWKKALGSLISKEPFTYLQWQVWAGNNGYEDLIQYLPGCAPWEVEPDENGMYN